MDTFPELAQAARRKRPEFSGLSRNELVRVAREYVQTSRAEIRKRHESGASGADIVGELTRLADEVAVGTLDFALYPIENRRVVMQSISLCAQGGYGRAQLNPYSDLDIGILYEGAVTTHLRAVDKFISPFLFDIGYSNSCVVRDVNDAANLAKRDMKVFTSYLECRLLAGATGPYARLRLAIRGMRPGESAESFSEAKLRERNDSLPVEHRELYAPEPNVKEGAGGLRDYHAGLWLLTVRYGITTLDQAAGQGIITTEERLELAEALDYLWRVRNQLHFAAGKADDRLTFKNQQSVAKVFGYIGGPHEGTTRLMEDYYGAARKIRRFLRKIARSCDYADAGNLLATPRPGSTEIAIEEGELYAGHNDPRWFGENPARLMSVFWECARRDAALSHPTEQLIEKSLHLVNDSFRGSDLVRRFFVAIANRPMQAGRAFRQAAQTGLLGAYLPEFAAVQDIVRYEDFHSYPVDEHTLRAIEALSYLKDLDGPVANSLQTALEHLGDPYILVLALLFHDLGKAQGEVHVEEGVAIAYRIGERIGLSPDDRERIAFLVQHHLLMSEIGIYRDTDEESVVVGFARTMKSADRLRALYLLTYADMSAVGPNVWNDWKGTLLLKLYLRAERVLVGRATHASETIWDSKKAAEVREIVGPGQSGRVESHLRDLGERYFIAFDPREIASHIDCVDEARREGFALRFDRNEGSQLSRVVVCTRDHSGLFANISGCFASQLIDVNDAALFTLSDGTTLDCFTVANAVRRRPLTKTQEQAVEKTLRDVLVGGQDVEEHLARAQRRLFGLMQPTLPVPTRIEFDNESSAKHTVVDVQTGDRTGILYSIVTTLTTCGLDIANARIVTDAHRVRDSFYVTLQGAKIKDKDIQHQITEAVRDAIHPRPAVEKGGSV